MGLVEVLSSVHQVYRHTHRCTRCTNAFIKSWSTMQRRHWYHARPLLLCVCFLSTILFSLWLLLSINDILQYITIMSSCCAWFYWWACCCPEAKQSVVVVCLRCNALSLASGKVNDIWLSVWWRGARRHGPLTYSRLVYLFIFVFNPWHLYYQGLKK